MAFTLFLINNKYSLKMQVRLDYPFSRGGIEKVSLDRVKSLHSSRKNISS